MILKEKIKTDAGLQYVVDHLEIMSSVGRRTLLSRPWLTNPSDLETEYDNIAAAVEVTKDETKRHAYNDLRHRLMELHDLSGTFNNLASHTVLDEVELFETKSFTHVVNQARRAAAELGLDDILQLPDLGEPFALLDPDHTGIANFYIYDSYDERLTPIRHELRSQQSLLASLSQNDENYTPTAQRISDLLAAQNELQNAICRDLSDKLFAHHDKLVTAMEQMGYADILLAEAELTINWNLCRPTIGESSEFAMLVNPRLRERNEKAGLRYQPIDVAFSDGVTLITGANMAGKTVLLKSIATAQAMAQFGMYVPTSKAVITIVDDIYCSIGDEQDEMNGLSSFASEIIKISRAIELTTQSRLLVLIDEPARTTNPIEGKAIVQSLISIMESRPSPTMITTHYSQLGSNCNRLRVRGFVESMVNVPINPQNINRFIDYSLIPDQSDEVPQEALRIASILGCNTDLVELASRCVCQNEGLD
ncbi:MAG: DNA mismatch repair protein MutS [Bacteroidales bacterium]|nr:DNA mismatch repair protein MutS [Bacteroidales bacterium]